MILEKRKLKYDTARDLILDAILSGDLTEDLALPSEQVLCRKLGIGRNTVRTALHKLEEDGIVIKQNGRTSRVDPAALRKRRTPLRRIAWVDTSPIHHTNPIYFDIFRSVSEQAAVRNVQLDYISLSIEAMAENFFRRQNEYHGLILGEFTVPFRKYISDITHKNTVSVDCPHPGIAHCVKTDSRLGGRLAAQALIESGHKAPAFLGFSRKIRNYEPFDERFAGFRDELRRAGIALPPELVLRISSADEEVHFDEFLKRHRDSLRQADGLFVLADNFAVTALYALPKMGIRVPRDLSLIGFDGLTLSRFVSPVLTTIRQPVEEIGKKALEIVLNPSESASYPELIRIPPVLLPGESLRNRIAKRSKIINKNKTERKTGK